MPPPLDYYFFFTFIVFLVKADKFDPTILSAIHESKISGKHLFFYFSLPHTSCIYFLITQKFTFYLPTTSKIFFLFT